MSKKLNLRKIPLSQVTIFKIRNRRGYAAICKSNLTEGFTKDQAIARLNKALKRIGCIV